MATPFQGLSIMENFGFIFPFLLVLVIVWGILNSIKLFGDNKTVNGVIAVVLALVTLFSPIVRDSISTMAPWFILLFFFMIFALIAFKIFGFSDSDIMGAISSGTYNYVLYWVAALVILIGIFSTLFVVANSGGIGGADSTITLEDGSVASSNQEQGFWSTIVHPKVLGFILIMLIAMFTVQRLTAAS